MGACASSRTVLEDAVVSIGLDLYPDATIEKAHSWGPDFTWNSVDARFVVSEVSESSSGFKSNSFGGVSNIPENAHLERL